jgi:hypothetical protein
MLVNTNTTAASLSAVDGQHLLNSLFRTVNDERFTVPVEFVNKFVTMHWEHEPYVLPADADKNQLWQLLILQIKKLINFNLLKFVVEAVRNTATIRAYRRTNDCSIIDATYDCCKRAFWNDMVSPRSFNKVLECGHPWSELGKGLEQLDKQQLRSRLIHIKTLAPWFANGDWLGGLSDELLKKL